MLDESKWLQWNTCLKICGGNSLSSEVCSCYNPCVSKLPPPTCFLSQKPSSHLGHCSPPPLWFTHLSSFPVLSILSFPYFPDALTLPHSHYPSFGLSDVDDHHLLQGFLPPFSPFFESMIYRPTKSMENISFLYSKPLKKFSFFSG